MAGAISFGVMSFSQCECQKFAFFPSPSLRQPENTTDNTDEANTNNNSSSGTNGAAQGKARGSAELLGRCGPIRVREGGRTAGWTRSTLRVPGGAHVSVDTAHGAEGARGAGGLGLGSEWRMVWCSGPARGGRRRPAEMDGGRRGSHRSTDRRYSVMGEHTGTKRRTRGDDPMARMRRRRSDGGGLRRRPLAAAKEGNRRWSTRVRFEAAGAYPGLGELISSAGWGNGPPREAGDGELPLGAGGNGGKPMAGGGETWGSVHAMSVWGGRETDLGGGQGEELAVAPVVQAVAGGDADGGRAKGKRRGGERELCTCRNGKRRWERGARPRALPPSLGRMRTGGSGPGGSAGTGGARA
uniref:Epstein-Barr virus EBNA-1-like protein n=1 Tax=Oryza sativa subsp. japonica TaxID=39947 RepID=Q69RV7_ORYSJ|nr:Epstein-Barr virus EBNA-1-like protein [Oryza sativa Japonica Group]BAD30989.1 Epstein-Barr virus EBNA-1-like protein [Oryza sativa Japonica Group]